MDYESAWVRAKAIDATIEMFSYSNASPPGNLVDTLVVHLRDPKVVVHKAALRALSRRPGWFDERQSREAMAALVFHVRAYRDDKLQLENIAEAALRMGKRNSRLREFALHLVESFYPTNEQLADSQIAEHLVRFCEPDEPLAPRVAKAIVMFLGRYDRDRYNSYGDSKRDRMFAWLHSLSLDGFQLVADSVMAAAQEMAKRDHWESFQFASVFSRFGAFHSEEDVLVAVAKALPQEAKWEDFHNNVTQVAAIAAGNALLQAGDPSAAETQFDIARGKS
jgi:hypothetical protein